MYNIGGKGNKTSEKAEMLQNDRVFKNKKNKEKKRKKKKVTESPEK